MIPSRSVLIVDDQQSMRSEIKHDLEMNNFTVAERAGYTAAVDYLSENPTAFVLLDRLLSTGEVENRGLKEICDVAGGATVIVYTEREMSDAQKYHIRELGAARVIKRADIPPNMQVFSRELKEMMDLSDELGSIRGERNRIVAVLVGIDVGVTIVDKEFHCWFANEQQNRLVGTECRGGLCWKLFHDRPGEWGPCWGCIVERSIRTGHDYERVFLSRFRDGNLGWVRVRTKPVKDSADNTIAAREAVSTLDPNTLPLIDRLKAIAQGLMQIGFARARVFRADGSTLRPVAAAHKDDKFEPEEDGYFGEVAASEYEVKVDMCACLKSVAENRVATVIGEGDERSSTPYTKAWQLKPPFLEVPVWRTDGQLAGWISADLVGLGEPVFGSVKDRWLGGAEDIKWIEEHFGKEVLHALEAVNPAQQEQNDIINRAMIDVGGANSVQSALDAVKGALGKLLPGRRISIRRLLRDKQLVEDEHLCLGQRDGGTPSRIAIDDRRSLAAMAARSVKAVWLDDRKQSNVPESYAGPNIISTASIALIVEGSVVGTMSIDSSKETHWEKDGLIGPLERLARVVALVVRDTNLSANIDRDDVAAYAASSLKSYVERYKIEAELENCHQLAVTLKNLAQDGADTTKPVDEMLTSIGRARAILSDRPEEQKCQLSAVANVLKERYSGHRYIAATFEVPVPNLHLAIPESIASGILDTLIGLSAIAPGTTPAVPVQVRVSATIDGTDCTVRVSPSGPVNTHEYVIARGAAIAFQGDLKIEEAEPAFRLRLPVM
jgi:CheY-like chemotaxis protein